MPRIAPTALSLAVIATFFAFLAAGPAMAQQAARPMVNLKPVWEEGQTSRYKSTTRRQIQREVVGQDVKQNQLLVFEAELTWKVIEADEQGGGEVEMKIDDLSMKVTEGKGKTYTATPNRADEQLAAAQALLKGLTSKPVRMTIGPDGSVERVSGWKSLANAAGDSGESLTETDFKELAVEIALLPGAMAEAAVGQTWDETFEWSHEMGQMELETQYKLVALERVAGVPIADIQAASEIDIELDREKFAKPGGADGPKVDMKFNGGKQAAQIMYDLSRNEVVGQNISRRLQFQVDVSYRGRSFKQLLTHSMNTQVIRLDEE